MDIVMQGVHAAEIGDRGRAANDELSVVVGRGLRNPGGVPFLIEVHHVLEISSIAVIVAVARGKVARGRLAQGGYALIIFIFIVRLVCPLVLAAVYEYSSVSVNSILYGTPTKPRERERERELHTTQSGLQAHLSGWHIGLLDLCTNEHRASRGLATGGDSRDKTRWEGADGERGHELWTS